MLFNEFVIGNTYKLSKDVFIDKYHNGYSLYHKGHLVVLTSKNEDHKQLFVKSLQPIEDIEATKQFYVNADELI